MEASNKAKVETERSPGTELQAAEDEHEQARLPKLYSLSTVVKRKEYGGAVYKDVTFSWFVERDKPPVPYGKAILNYEPSKDGSKQYEEGAVDELFTQAEARVFAAYLLAVHGDTVSFEEVSLPWDCEGRMATGAVPVGGGTDIYMIHKEPEYNLGFKVSGFYNIRACAVAEAEEVTKTERQCLTIGDFGDTVSIICRLRALHYKHFSYVEGAVRTLVRDAQGSGQQQATVDISLLRDIWAYFVDYENGEMLPKDYDVPF